MCLVYTPILLKVEQADGGGLEFPVDLSQEKP